LDPRGARKDTREHAQNKQGGRPPWTPAACARTHGNTPRPNRKTGSDWPALARSGTLFRLPTSGT
jgi:hypothetical protein